MGWSARTFPTGWRPKIGPISPEHLNVGTPRRLRATVPSAAEHPRGRSDATARRSSVSMCRSCRVYSSLGWPPRASPPLGAGTNSRRDRAAVGCRQPLLRRPAAHEHLVDDHCVKPCPCGGLLSHVPAAGGRGLERAHRAAANLARSGHLPRPGGIGPSGRCCSGVTPHITGLVGTRAGSRAGHHRPTKPIRSGKHFTTRSKRP